VYGSSQSGSSTQTTPPAPQTNPATRPHVTPLPK